jgi:cytochrome c-type biogenesis protein CcmH
MKWIAVAFAFMALVPTAAAAVPARASLPDVEDEVMCIVCGTLLAESEAPQADRERALIRKLIGQGEDKDQIKDALVAEYGQRVLATPSGHGFDLLAWIVPGLGIALVGGGLVFAALRLRRKDPAEPQAQPDLDPADEARLREDLSNYER